MREHGDDHLRLVAIAVDKERADRPVDQAGHQGLALGGTTLALEIPARNAACREGFFLIVDGERKEVLAGLRGFGGDDGGEHCGLAPTGEHGAVRLTGDLARLEHELAPCPVEFFAVNLKHIRSFFHEASRWSS